MARWMVYDEIERYVSVYSRLILNDLLTWSTALARLSMACSSILPQLSETCV